jgi:hypothetical protein
MDRFPELCVAVHMADEYNAAQFLIVNITLHFLFRAYGSLLPEKEEEYSRLSHICSVNSETALSNLPLHLPATDDVIIALSFGVLITRGNTVPHCSPTNTLIRPITPSSLPNRLWLGSCCPKHPSCASLSAITGVRHTSTSPRRAPSASSSSSGVCTLSTRASHFAWGGHRRYKITMSPCPSRRTMGPHALVTFQSHASLACGSSPRGFKARSMNYYIAPTLLPSQTKSGNPAYSCC